MKRSEPYWIHCCGFIIWSHEKLFHFNITALNKITNLLPKKKKMLLMVKEKHDLVLKVTDNSIVLRSMPQALSLLHDVETLTHSEKRHSGATNKFKFPVACQSLNLGKKNPLGGLLTLCWSTRRQKHYPLSTVDRLRDLQRDLGQRHYLCLSLYSRSCTVRFCQDQVRDIHQCLGKLKFYSDVSHIRWDTTNLFLLWKSSNSHHSLWRTWYRKENMTLLL